MSNFQMDADWLPFHPNPSAPEFKVPANSVDAHCHVFGPGDDFPYAPQRKYTPCDASKHQLFALRDHLGFSRNVIVQATCHGSDNRALVDALEHSDGKARGVATLDSAITDKELEELHAAGVRGARFNFVKRLVDAAPVDKMRDLAARIAPLGWHVVIYFEAADLPEHYDFFQSLPTPIVVDHMGRPDVSEPLEAEGFQRFVRFMSERDDIYSKVSCPERLSIEGPDRYSDVVPFAKTLVEQFSDRVLWGTDWPHPNMKSHVPDDGKLVDYIPSIATSAELQEKLLVSNPMALYWSDSA